MNNTSDSPSSLDEMIRTYEKDNEDINRLNAIVRESARTEQDVSLSLGSLSRGMIKTYLNAYDPEYLKEESEFSYYDKEEALSYQDILMRSKQSGAPLTLYLQHSRPIRFTTRKEWENACNKHGKIFRAVYFNLNSGVDFTDLIGVPLEFVGISVDLDRKVQNFVDHETAFDLFTEYIEQNCAALETLGTLKILKCDFRYVPRDLEKFESMLDICIPMAFFYGLRNLDLLEEIVVPTMNLNIYNVFELLKDQTEIRRLAVRRVMSAHTFEILLRSSKVSTLEIVSPVENHPEIEGYRSFGVSPQEMLYIKI